MVKKNSIPGGWRNVLPIGQAIPGTRFIPFKAPLKGEINQRLTPAQKFTPKDLIVAMKALNLELGLIIDLTYTTRYYHVKDLPKSVEYKKLYTIGFEVPDDPTILQFKKWVRKFLWENAENDKVIGVHCTNGINRTGYLICRYLIDVEGWDPDTAIQAFGEARGHHIDGKIYLADLKTQPMRSNLGMNLWDTDGDIVPPPNDMNGHSDRFPNEEFPRSAKRLRVFDYGHSELSEEIQLREFDFMNKGPGQQQKPYRDHQFQDLQPLVQAGSTRQFYANDYQEHTQLNDLDFSTRQSEQRQSPFRDRQFCEDVSGSTPSGHLISMECRHRQKPFRDIPLLSDMIDTELNRGHGGRQRSFNDPQPNDKFQSHGQLKETTFLNKRPMQRIRLLRDQSPQNDGQSPVGDFEFVSRGHGQRSMPFLNHSDVLRRQVPLKDFDDRDSGSRCRPFHDNQSYSDTEEQTPFKGFLNREPERITFHTYSPSDDTSCERYLERDHPFLSHERLSKSPLLQRDYGSNKDNYSRSCRSVCSENYRSYHSEEKGGKTRFAPYSSHQMHGPPSIPQKVNSVSVNHRGEPQREITRELSQGKRLPVVTIDYNYGLPLGYTSSEEDRTHLRTRECHIWK